MVSRTKKRGGGLWDTIKTVFWALLIAMVFRSFLYQPFSIPSGSMKPTLLVGDYLFVSKFSYGYSNFSLPFAPKLWKGRIWSSMPKRGDVVVFKKPGKDKCTEGTVPWLIRMGTYVVSRFGLATAYDGPNDCTDYIKRLVGLPGDRIQMKDGVLHVNGVAVGMQKIGNFVDFKRSGAPNWQGPRCIRQHRPPADTRCEAEQFVETLPVTAGKTVKHAILNYANLTGHPDNTDVFVVEEGKFFFMGDNRDGSQDSRFADVGQVPFKNLIGRAEVIVLSSEGSFIDVRRWRLGRFFKSIE